MVAIALQRQSWVVMTEAGLQKPEIFIVWPFTENVCWNLWQKNSCCDSPVYWWRYSGEVYSPVLNFQCCELRVTGKQGMWPKCDPWECLPKRSDSRVACSSLTHGFHVLLQSPSREREQHLWGKRDGMFSYIRPCLFPILAPDSPCQPDAASCHAGEAYMMKNSGLPLAV